jgi:hypothetical protein
MGPPETSPLPQTTAGGAVLNRNGPPFAGDGIPSDVPSRGRALPGWASRRRAAMGADLQWPSDMTAGNEQ